MGRTPYKYTIKLSGQEKRELQQAKRKGRKDARLVIRILIILLADQGYTIGDRRLFRVHRANRLELAQAVSGTSCRRRPAALMDLPRSGRLPLYGAKERAQVPST
jgi:hypothetical protein